MIVVAAHLVVNKGDGDKLLEATKECIRETRKEEGNISYNLLRNTEDDCKFMFFEEWETRENLDCHMKALHYLKYREGLEKISIVSRDVNVYEVNK